MCPDSIYLLLTKEWFISIVSLCQNTGVLYLSLFLSVIHIYIFMYMLPLKCKIQLLYKIPKYYIY